MTFACRLEGFSGLLCKYEAPNIRNCKPCHPSHEGRSTSRGCAASGAVDRDHHLRPGLAALLLHTLQCCRELRREILNPTGASCQSKKPRTQKSYPAFPDTALQPVLSRTAGPGPRWLQQAGCQHRPEARAFIEVVAAFNLMGGNEIHKSC